MVFICCMTRRQRLKCCTRWGLACHRAKACCARCGVGEDLAEGQAKRVLQIIDLREREETALEVRGKERDRLATSNEDMAVNVMVMFMTFMQVSLTRQIVAVFMCAEVGERQVLVASTSPKMECWTGEHYGLIAFAMAAAFVYVIIFLVWLINKLYRVAREDTQRLRVTHRTRYGYLYQHYAKNAWLWEIKIMLLKLTVVLVRGVMSTRPLFVAQVSSLFVAVAGFLCVHLAFWKMGSAPGPLRLLNKPHGEGMAAEDDEPRRRPASMRSVNPGDAEPLQGLGAGNGDGPDGHGGDGSSVAEQADAAGEEGDVDATDLLFGADAGEAKSEAGEAKSEAGEAKSEAGEVDATPSELVAGLISALGGHNGKAGAAAAAAAEDSDGEGKAEVEEKEELGAEEVLAATPVTALGMADGLVPAEPADAKAEEIPDDNSDVPEITPGQRRGCCSNWLCCRRERDLPLPDKEGKTPLPERAELTQAWQLDLLKMYPQLNEYDVGGRNAPFISDELNRVELFGLLGTLLLLATALVFLQGGVQDVTALEAENKEVEDDGGWLNSSTLAYLIIFCVGANSMRMAAAMAHEVSRLIGVVTLDRVAIALGDGLWDMLRLTFGCCCARKEFLKGRLRVYKRLGLVYHRKPAAA